MTRNLAKPPLTDTQAKEVKHFLKTGDTDSLARNWPGGPMLGGQMAKAAMIDALIDEIEKRTVGLREASIPLEDANFFIREKVSPMIEGFFPATERAIVLARIEKSVLFLTTKTVEPILRKTQANISWDLCNIFLLSVGAKALSKTG